MNWRTLALIGLACGLAGATRVQATECPGNPNALGTSRVLTIDPQEYPRIGTVQYSRSLPLAEKEVVLTFDDGPMPPYTTRVLEVLAEQCVKANYFIIGRMARGYPELIRQVHAAGHVIGTHSQNHPLAFERMSIEAVKAEIEQGIVSVGTALGDRRAVAPFFRIPGLLRAKHVETYLQSRQLTAWSADVVADDWKHISAAEVVRRAISRLDEKGKGILLLHDIQPATALALPELLRQLKTHGYRIVQVVPGTPGAPVPMAAKPSPPPAAVAAQNAPPAPPAAALARELIERAQVPTASVPVRPPVQAVAAAAPPPALAVAPTSEPAAPPVQATPMQVQQVKIVRPGSTTVVTTTVRSRETDDQEEIERQPRTNVPIQVRAHARVQVRAQEQVAPPERDPIPAQADPQAPPDEATELSAARRGDEDAQAKAIEALAAAGVPRQPPPPPARPEPIVPGEPIRPYAPTLKPAQGITTPGKLSSAEPGGPRSVNVPVPRAGGVGVSAVVRSSDVPEGRFQEQR